MHCVGNTTQPFYRAIQPIKRRQNNIITKMQPSAKISLGVRSHMFISIFKKKNVYNR